MSYEGAISAHLASSLRVSEIFGPTLQGEGASVGKQCWFIRLSGCNLECSWCDTPYTWDWSGKNGKKFDKKQEEKVMQIANVVDEVRFANHVVITGGEPLVQSRALIRLLNALELVGISAEVETNGTRPYPIGAPLGTRWNISPKLLSSGNGNGIRPKALASYPLNSIFKFVITDPSDIDEILDLKLPRKQTYLMPEGRTLEEINDKAKWVAELAIQNGMNFSYRLHILLWGSERGH